MESSYSELRVYEMRYKESEQKISQILQELRYK